MGWPGTSMSFTTSEDVRFHKKVWISTNSPVLRIRTGGEVIVLILASKKVRNPDYFFVRHAC